MNNTVCIHMIVEVRIIYIVVSGGQHVTVISV